MYPTYPDQSLTRFIPNIYFLGENIKTYLIKFLKVVKLGKVENTLSYGNTILNYFDFENINI